MLAKRRAIPAVILIAVLAVGSWFVFFQTNHSRTVSADFAYVNGVYEGSKVDVLGVPVGTVKSVTPDGDHVRVTMSVPSDIQFPANVEAYVMNPSVISDRFVELGPTYKSGETFADDAVIPVKRSHSPINWDQLMDSVNTITSALGPDRGDMGQTLKDVAKSTKGMGPDINRAIRDVSQATSVIGASSEDIGKLIDNLNTVVSTFAARQHQVDSVTDSLDSLGKEIQSQNLDVGTPIAQLKVLFDQIDKLITDRGGDIKSIIDNTMSVTGQFASHEGEFAEFMDMLPLAMQNLGNTIGPDGRTRIRLDVSTQLGQFAGAIPICKQYALPICTGAGFTNPVQLPLSASDPLGIASILGGPK